MKKFVSCLLGSLLLCGASCLAHNEKYVNLFLGSQGDHGQMTPGAAVPFGMISVCPDSDPGQHGGYDYEVPEISGISVNRISGVGCAGVGGNLRLRPASPEAPLAIVKGTEKAVPGFYGTTFSNGASGRFTATRDVAIEEYVFSPTDKTLHLDALSSFEKGKVEARFEILPDGHTIRGRIAAGTACARGQYRYFFTLTSSAPFTVAGRTETEATLSFRDKGTEIRIGLSSVDAGSADAALHAIAGKRFDALAAEARGQWREKLGKIQVKGGTKEQKVLFYTSLYRIYLSPMDVTSADGRYLGTDGAIHTVEPGRRHYSSWSMWDTFRTKFPMLFILEPEASRDICASLVDLYVTGKQNWATPHESAPSVRTEHSQIVLLDAWRKGIRGFDLDRAWDGMVREAAEELPRKSLDNKMETSYDLWAMGEIAALLGKDGEARRYAEEGEAMFDGIWPENFMTVTPVFKQMKNNGMYQGTRWQYRWSAPQYIGKMIGWKGREALCEELLTFFDDHNFNQGNEPDIHTPFMFNLFGRPDLTSRVVAELLTKEDMIHVYGGNAEYPEPFVGRAFRNRPDGYAPEMDEDDGAMSAWYMFAQMGLYPVVVGTDSYAAFAPYFDKITVRAGGKKTVIRAKGRKAYGEGVPVKLLVDGEEQPEFTLSHAVFSEGKKVTFVY